MENSKNPDHLLPIPKPVSTNPDAGEQTLEPPVKASVPDLSICIVSLQARNYLEKCIESIIDNTQKSYEIIVVDNGSTDGTSSMIMQKWSEIKLIKNEKNRGFTFPTNQALKISKGKFMLLLNPDTIILDSALDKLADFLESNPEAGVCGPKVLNPDGSLQAPCRRGESRPWAVISHVTGLSRHFPKNPFFSEYHLSYLDENETHPVAGVAGSCMLIRREVIEKIGYLDEAFFAYQEDADFCYRVREAGWTVYYYPESRIIHFGGQGGSKVEPNRSIISWHYSYYLYFKKNLSKDYFFLFNWLFYLAMFFKLLFTLIRNLFSREIFGGSRKPG